MVTFQIGQLSFSYLRVPLFPGKPKKSVLQHIVDKILSKFAKWKGKALSLAGRATLIQSVITGSFVHSFMIYKWPSSLLRLVNLKLRNFLHTGSCEETKLIRVAWNRCCKPYSQGGLGLKDLGLLNDSLLKKLTWKFMTSESFVFSFLRKRYLTQLRKSHGEYVTSSIWPSFRSHYLDHLKEGIWLISENSQRDFWCNNWLGVPILELLWNPDYLANLFRARVSYFIHKDNLLILRRFDLRGHPSRGLVIRTVIWSPPAPGWIKVNTDGAALSSPDIRGCMGVFRNCRAFVKGCFAVSLGQVFTFEARSRQNG
ncbi:hypothetical protein Dsin_002071 [Dipteronia sinensis]|uniref:Reverse transcriptase n=1 Tax=Dipteronia sinensis TaxID=43782 RepID=A0AAE0B6G3_9ROSI|nr:hypothetical protein Dsin_002071 [Dipteronia sinensis]